MSEVQKCKKCGGTGEHRRGQPCGTCKGAKTVVVTVDPETKAVVSIVPNVPKAGSAAPGKSSSTAPGKSSSTAPGKGARS